MLKTLALPFTLLLAAPVQAGLLMDVRTSTVAINIAHHEGDTEKLERFENMLRADFSQCLRDISSKANPISMSALPVAEKVELALDHCIQPFRYLGAVGAANPATRTWASEIAQDLESSDHLFTALSFGDVMFRVDS